MIGEVGIELGHRLTRIDLGEVPYREALGLMAGWVEERRAGTAPDRLFLLSHPGVVTYGKHTPPTDLPRAEDGLERSEHRERGRGGAAAPAAFSSSADQIFAAWAYRSRYSPAALAYPCAIATAAFSCGTVIGFGVCLPCSAKRAKASMIGAKSVPALAKK